MVVSWLGAARSAAVGGGGPGASVCAIDGGGTESAAEGLVVSTGAVSEVRTGSSTASISITSASSKLPMPPDWFSPGPGPAAT